MAMPKSKLSCFLRSQDGGILVMSTLLLPVFLGFMALAIDVGLWYQSKRHLQLLADSLAMGGIYALSNGSNVTTYVTHDAQLNGFAATNGRTMTINTPPTSGGYSGNNKAVEVLLTAPSNRYFSASFLPNAFSISARAVALMAGSSSSPIGNGCLSVMDKTSNAAFYADGGTNVNFTQCGVYVNSNSSTALKLDGSATLTTNYLSIVGNYIKNWATINSTTPIVTGAAAIADPYAGTIPTPTFSGCNFNNYNPAYTPSTITLNPGVYCNGINLDNVDNIFLNPGLYIIDRGTLKLDNSAILKGNGVTLFFTSSNGGNFPNFEIKGASVVQLTAPTSGTYNGIVAFSTPQAPNVTHKVSEGASLKLTGLVYFPTGDYEFSGGTSTNDCIRLVINKIKFTGSASLTGTCVGAIGSSAQTFSLVE